MVLCVRHSRLCLDNINFRTHLLICTSLSIKQMLWIGISKHDRIASIFIVACFRIVRSYFSYFCMLVVLLPISSSAERLPHRNTESNTLRLVSGQVKQFVENPTNCFVCVTMTSNISELYVADIYNSLSLCPILECIAAPCFKNINILSGSVVLFLGNALISHLRHVLEIKISIPHHRYDT